MKYIKLIIKFMALDSIDKALDTALFHCIRLLTKCKNKEIISELKTLETNLYQCRSSAWIIRDYFKERKDL